MIEERSKAPDFSALDQDGELHTLENYNNKKIVLFFYPKDDTSGCTAQACNLNDNLDLLHKEGYVVLGVSIDDEKSHQKFRQKYNLRFPLLVDRDKKMVNDYGVWGEKSMYGKKYMGTFRTTFIIENGIIEKIISKVDTKNHASQILV